MTAGGLSRYFYAQQKSGMSAIIIILIASSSVAVVFLVAFILSVKSGQFEDDYSPPSRILFDDKPSTHRDPEIL